MLCVFLSGECALDKNIENQINFFSNFLSFFTLFSIFFSKKPIGISITKKVPGKFSDLTFLNKTILFEIKF